jgi:hypothetical protein
MHVTRYARLWSPREESLQLWNLLVWLCKKKKKIAAGEMAIMHLTTPGQSQRCSRSLLRHVHSTCGGAAALQMIRCTVLLILQLFFSIIYIRKCVNKIS